MAIPISGSFSIGSLRTELQNTGLATFSLRECGRPTTGAPGTFQNPRYTPVNQSSSVIPNDSAPYQMSEWRGYNHSENVGCKGETYILMMNDLSQFDLYRYDFDANTAISVQPDFTAALGDDIAMTRNKLFIYVTPAAAGPAIQEYDITLLPWQISTGRFITLSETAGGIFAKNNTTIVYWIEVGLTCSIKEADITTTTATITTLFTINTTTNKPAGELYYDSLNNKYFLPYASGGVGIPPYYVGRWSSTGTLEVSVPTDRLIDGIFTVGLTAYGVTPDVSGTSSVYMLDFAGVTSSFVQNIVGLSVRGTTQYNYSDTGFTTPTLGPFYTYYRVALRGSPSYQVSIDVTGNSTTQHDCYIYLNYPFDNVGQRTGTAWTYSRFSSSTTKTFVRSMTASNETLHFVLFEDTN